MLCGLLGDNLAGECGILRTHPHAGTKKIMQEYYGKRKDGEKKLRRG